MSDGKQDWVGHGGWGMFSLARWGEQEGVGWSVLLLNLGEVWFVVPSYFNIYVVSIIILSFIVSCHKYLVNKKV